MAYRRKRQFRRKNNRYNRFKRKYMSYSKMAYQAYRGYKLIKGLVNVEKKLFTNNAFSATPDNTGVVTVLNTITAGDDANQRNGNSILAKYMTTRFYVTQNASATNTVLRCIIVQDLQNQGATPAVTDILQAAAATSPMNNDNVERFWILYDKMITLSTGGNTMIPITNYKALNFHCKYTGTASTTFSMNAICMLLISNEVTNTPAVTGYWRLAFYDN